MNLKSDREINDAVDRVMAESLYDPKKMPVKSQIAFIKKQLRGKGIEPDLIDIDALIDNELTYRENYENIMQHLAASGEVEAAESAIIKNPA